VRLIDHYLGIEGLFERDVQMSHENSRLILFEGEVGYENDL
jgi:hypothetical protein